VDRIVQRMVEGIPHDFTVRNYGSISSAKLLKLAREHDLVHYANWTIKHHRRVWDDLFQLPFLLTVRSHRYPAYVKEVAARVSCVHVVNPKLLEDFPEAVYIPTGIFEQFWDERFVVGSVARRGDYGGKNLEYKGIPLIERACAELGVEFRPAFGDMSPGDMVEYYRSLNVYVCASVAEGHSTCVMECLAMNVPVISTDAGPPSAFDLGVTKVERTVGSIKEAISKFYTAPKVAGHNWVDVCARFSELYERMVDDHSE